MLEHAEFLAGRTDTHFLVRHDPAELAAPLVDRPGERLHAAAAALAGAGPAGANRRRVLRPIPSGWRNNPSQFQQATLRRSMGRDRRSNIASERDGVALGNRRRGSRPPCVFTSAAQTACDFELDGIQRTYDVHRVGDTFYVDSPLGSSELREIPRFSLPEEDVRPARSWRRCLAS